METLAPREAYDQDDSGAERRLRLVLVLASAILVTIVVAVAFAVVRPASAAYGPSYRTVIAFAIGLGVLYGIPRALLDWREDVRQWRSRMDRVYAGDLSIIGPPPIGATQRLPCAYMLSATHSMPGILYVVPPRGLVFVPNASASTWAQWWNNQRPQRLMPLEIGPPRTITLDTNAVLRLPWWQRAFVPRPVPVLLVRWEGGVAPLRAVGGSEVSLRLQAAIDQMRAPSGVASAV